MYGRVSLGVMVKVMVMYLYGRVSLGVMVKVMVMYLYGRVSLGVMVKVMVMYLYGRVSLGDGGSAEGELRCVTSEASLRCVERAWVRVRWIVTGSGVR